MGTVTSTNEQLTMDTLRSGPSGTVVSARGKCQMDPLNQNEIKRCVEIKIIDNGQLTVDNY